MYTVPRKKITTVVLTTAFIVSTSITVVSIVVTVIEAASR